MERRKPMEMITFRESIDATQKHKEAYLSGIENIIRHREQLADNLRIQKCMDVLANQDVYRADLQAFLGWPLTEKRPEHIPLASVEKLSEDDQCIISRVTVEVLEGYSITGLLFQLDKKQRPLVIAQHGGDGTPEQVGNLYGDTYNYNHMIERMLAYNVNVFAPQLLLWNTDNFGVAYQRDVLDARLKNTGSSIAALEIYAITRVLDYFQSQDCVSNFGMLGLSYGGFYTLYTAAIDKRIQSAVACSFSHTSKQSRCDWTWRRFRESFSDAEIACLVYPRRLSLEMGDTDPLFDLKDLEKEVLRLNQLAGNEKDWFKYSPFAGGHEFCWDDKPLKILAEDIQ